MAAAVIYVCMEYWETVTVKLTKITVGVRDLGTNLLDSYLHYKRWKLSGLMEVFCGDVDRLD